jgi:hypothetical protein
MIRRGVKYSIRKSAAMAAPDPKGFVPISVALKPKVLYYEGMQEWREYRGE